MRRMPMPGRRIAGLSTTRSAVLVGALACVTAVVLVVGIAAADQREGGLTSAPCSVGAGATAVSTVPDRLQAPFELDFATVADGSVPPRSNGFEVSTISGDSNGYGLRVINGHLCHGSPLAGNAASYLETTLTTPVTRIGATATFPAYSGSVGLVAWQESFAGSGGRIPNAGIHLVFGANDWHFGVWQEGQGEAVLGSGTFTSSGFNTPHTFEATRNGDTVVVKLPDGQSNTISDPRIAEWTGAFPTWELYEYKPGVVPASINSIWAA